MKIRRAMHARRRSGRLGFGELAQAAPWRERSQWLWRSDQVCEAAVARRRHRPPSSALLHPRLPSAFALSPPHPACVPILRSLLRWRALAAPANSSLRARPRCLSLFLPVPRSLLARRFFCFPAGVGCQSLQFSTSQQKHLHNCTGSLQLVRS